MWMKAEGGLKISGRYMHDGLREWEGATGGGDGLKEEVDVSYSRKGILDSTLFCTHSLVSRQQS